MRRRPDPTDWMWAQACELIDQAERMHRQFFRLSASDEGRAVWEPPVDMFEDEREVVVVVALPGVAAQDVDVALEAGALVVRAQRPFVAGGTRHAVRKLEIPYGCFERRVALPSIAVESASHELTHGCLVVRLRKR